VSPTADCSALGVTGRPPCSLLRPIARPDRAARRACRPLSDRLLGRRAAARWRVVRSPADRSAGALRHAVRLGRLPVRLLGRLGCRVGVPSALLPIARPVRLETALPASPSDCSVGASQDVAPSALRPIARPARSRTRPARSPA